MRRAPLLVALSLALTSAPVLAAGEPDGFHLQGGLFDTSVHERHNLLTAYFEIPWGSAWGFPIGVGGRFYIPLVKDGFLPTINDEFGLEFGASIGVGFGFGYVSWGFDVPVHVLWGFHLTPDWMVYATLGIEAHIWFWPGAFGTNGGLYGWPVSPEGGVGFMWKIAPGWTLRGDVGFGLHIGLVWPM